MTDEKSDIYSVGVMLYEMLTGQKPFDTDNPVTVAVMHMQNTPERPRAINPDIPAGLEEVILRAMEKDAENRYQTASDMIRDIESFKANTSMTFGYYVEDVDDDAAYDEEDDDAMYAGAAAATAVTEFDDDDDYEYDDDDDSDDYYDDEDDEEEEEESHSLFIPVMTAVTIAFIVVAVIFVVWLIQGVLNGEGIKTTKYEMPDLVGMDYYEAKDQYTYLDIQINETKNSAYEKDIIYEQDITVGDAISEGEIVYVNVSLGVSEVKIPEVATFNYEYAAKILEQEGFVPDIKYEVSTEGIEAYAVIRTEPAAGEMAPSGSIVTIWVSKGVNAEDVEMPDLIGQTLESNCNVRILWSGCRDCG